MTTTFDDLLEEYVTTGQELARVQAAHAEVLRKLLEHPAGRQFIRHENAVQLAASAHLLGTQVEKAAAAMRELHTTR